MPGILPMKVIKVGNSAQSRIAQACDRCRSKKIRCDGVRPTCSQCANVGFECRTSDKLSRRAFPRGYTESLEERVRQLEAEVRELKDLLDEKDEKMDMLSALHANRRRRRPSLPIQPCSAPLPDVPKEDSFRVEAPALLLGVDSSDSYLMGPSSGRSLITSFKHKLNEAGKPCADFNPDAFLHVQGCPPLTTDAPDPSSRIPPRLFSDRCVNVFFQEWAPLFPVLHKPTFLSVYQEFVAGPERVLCRYKIAQLYLVFSIAGLSFQSPDYPQLAASERQWIKAVDALLSESTMSTLQCLILALIYCIVRGDNKRLQHYKSVAVGLSHRLGLHQSQRRFSFDALTLEMRKRVFWTLYTLDCFTAASLGLPRLLKDEGIEAEYPTDTDDEYVSERGFQPSLPGESTRLSSALALFRAARILARVLDGIYAAPANRDLSLQQMAALEGELDAWYAKLPAHLRLNFVQDKPSTDVTGSRSPLLALAYYYIRTLIYRPAVGSALGPKAAPALLSIADSSKHMVQIAQLLDERSMSFSFCLNKEDLLAVCGTTLLYQVADLKQDSKLMRDVERLVNAVTAALSKAKASGSAGLARAARLLVSADAKDAGSPAASRKGSMPAPSVGPSPAPRGAALGSGPGSAQGFPEHGGRTSEGQAHGERMTTGFVQAQDVYQGRCRQSFGRLSPDGTAMGHEDYSLSVSQAPGAGHRISACRSMPNLDYLSLSSAPAQTHTSSPGGPGRMQAAAASVGPPANGLLGHSADGGKMGRVSTAQWEALLGSLDGGVNNVYDAIYGGASLVHEAALAGAPNGQGAWDVGGFSVGDFGGDAGELQRLPSLSDESLSSGEEVAPSELGLSLGNMGDAFGGLLLVTLERQRDG